MCSLPNQFKCEKNMFFDQDTNQCQFCDISCLECISSTNCSKCNNRRHYIENGLCTEKCSDGSYALSMIDNNINRCIRCNSNCKTCENDSNNCSSCHQGFELNNKNECVSIVFNGNFQWLNLRL